MAITLPRWAKKEIVTAAKLNSMRDAIVNKFGAITAADITWPLVCEGNIDFNSTHSIVGLRTFWNIINADEYSTMQDAIDAAEAAGGGCVLIPPDTTITADGLTLTAGSVSIVGCGKSSILQLTSSSSSGFMLQIASTGLSDISIANLVIDGRSQGTAQKGIVAQRVTNFHMSNVRIEDFTGDALEFTNDGTSGNACVDARIENCTFSGGGADHLFADDIDGLQVLGCKFLTCAAGPINIEPDASAALAKKILLSSVDIDTTVGVGVSILGASATANDNWSLITLSGVQVTGTTTDAFNLGLALKTLKYVSMTDCQAPAAGNDGLACDINTGLIADCFFPTATSNGIDLGASDTVTVQGNMLRAAQAIGIVATGTEDAVIVNNDVVGAVTEGIDYAGATTPIIHDNPGMKGPSGFHYNNATQTSRTTNGDVTTYTLPADSVRVGDLIRVTALVSKTGTAGDATWALQLGNTAVGSTISTGTPAIVQETTWEVRVAALSGAGSAITTTRGQGHGGSNYVATTTATIDFTADLAIEIAVTITAGDTMTFRGISVEIIGGDGTA